MSFSLINSPLKAALAAVALTAVAMPAQADLYAGLAVGYTDAEYHQQAADELKANPVTAQLQLGYFFVDYFGLEARYGTSLKQNKGIDVDEVASILAKINIPTTPRLAFYGLAGYSSVKLDEKNLGKSSEDGASFGLGAHFAIDKKSAITAEFVNYLAGDEVRLSGAQLGIQVKF